MKTLKCCSSLGYVLIFWQVCTSVGNTYKHEIRVQDQGMNKLCHLPVRFSAIAHIRNELMVFYNETFQRLLPNGVWTRLEYTSNFWESGSHIKLFSVDAAYERFDGKIVLFNGDKLFLFDDSGWPTLGNYLYPQSIHSHLGLPYWVQSIDAAYSRDGVAYFFHKRFFWRMDERRGQRRVTPGRRSVRHYWRWTDAPARLAGALAVRGSEDAECAGDVDCGRRTLFFAADSYWIATEDGDGHREVSARLPSSGFWKRICRERSQEQQRGSGAARWHAGGAGPLTMAGVVLGLGSRARA